MSYRGYATTHVYNDKYIRFHLIDALDFKHCESELRNIGMFITINMYIFIIAYPCINKYPFVKYKVSTSMLFCIIKFCCIIHFSGIRVISCVQTHASLETNMYALRTIY